MRSQRMSPPMRAAQSPCSHRQRSSMRLRLREQWLTFCISKRFDRTFHIKHNITWTCKHCQARTDIKAIDKGIMLGITRDGAGVVQDMMASLQVFHQGDPITIRCEECETSEERQRIYEIVEAPEILVIQLARLQIGADGDYVESADVLYPETLDLHQFTQNHTALKYRLHGAVGHEGEDDAGHYIAAVRHRDDAGFSTVSDLNVVQSHGGHVNELLDLKYRGERFPWTCLIYVKE